MKYIAAEDIHPADYVSLMDDVLGRDGQPELHLGRTRHGNSPAHLIIGIAARAIARGETVSYDPHDNTADILTRSP